MNQSYENDLRDTQSEMLMHPMLSEKLNSACYDRYFMHSIQFFPTMVENYDYFTELENIERAAIIKQDDERFMSAFIKAKNDRNSAFYSPEGITEYTVRRINKQRYDELLMLKEINSQRETLKSSVAYNFYQLQHLPELQKANDPIYQLLRISPRCNAKKAMKSSQSQPPLQQRGIAEKGKLSGYIPLDPAILGKYGVSLPREKAHLTYMQPGKRGWERGEAPVREMLAHF